MSASTTGEDHFEFFEQMDEVFHKLPNIKPLSVASSSRGLQNLITLEPPTTSTPIEEDGESKNEVLQVIHRLNVNERTAQG